MKIAVLQTSLEISIYNQQNDIAGGQPGYF